MEKNIPKQARETNEKHIICICFFVTDIYQQSFSYDCHFPLFHSSSRCSSECHARSETLVLTGMCRYLYNMPRYIEGRVCEAGRGRDVGLG